MENSENDVEEKGRIAMRELELPLGEAAESFRLEKAVCSHGLFMMAPNYWDPLDNTLTRPLRLSLDDDRSKSSSSSSSSGSVIVSISQQSERPGSLRVRVHGTDSISPQQEHALLVRVFHVWFKPQWIQCFGLVLRLFKEQGSIQES